MRIFSAMHALTGFETPYQRGTDLALIAEYLFLFLITLFCWTRSRFNRNGSLHKPSSGSPRTKQLYWELIMLFSLLRATFFAIPESIFQGSYDPSPEHGGILHFLEFLLQSLPGFLFLSGFLLVVGFWAATFLTLWRRKNPPRYAPLSSIGVNAPASSQRWFLVANAVVYACGVVVWILWWSLPYFTAMMVYYTFVFMYSIAIAAGFSFYGFALWNTLSPLTGSRHHLEDAEYLLSTRDGALNYNSVQLLQGTPDYGAVGEGGGWEQGKKSRASSMSESVTSITASGSASVGASPMVGPLVGGVPGASTRSHGGTGEQVLSQSDLAALKPPTVAPGMRLPPSLSDRSPAGSIHSVEQRRNYLSSSLASVDGVDDDDDANDYVGSEIESERRDDAGDKVKDKMNTIALVASVCTLSFLLQAGTAAYIVVVCANGIEMVHEASSPFPRFWWLLVLIYHSFGEVLCSLVVVLALRKPTHVVKPAQGGQREGDF